MSQNIARNITRHTVTRLRADTTKPGRTAWALLSRIAIEGLPRRIYPEVYQAARDAYDDWCSAQERKGHENDDMYSVMEWLTPSARGRRAS